MGFEHVDLAVETLVLALLFCAGSAFVLTVVLGGLALGVAPAFTYQTMQRVSAEPIASCGYGLAVLLGPFALAIGISLSILGIFLAVPLLVLVVALWGVGAAIAFPLVGVRLVGSDGGLLGPLLLGALINALLTLTGIGLIIILGVGATGLGAIVLGFRDD